MGAQHRQKRNRAPRSLSETSKNEILRLLKLNGELSVAQLCHLRQVTHTAIRRQLSALQRDGLISQRAEETRAGRPVYMFRLSEKSAGCFPSDYEGLATNLIDTVLSSSGHRGVLEFLHTANDHLIDSLLVQMKELSFEQRVGYLCDYFCDAGYMSEWKRLPDGDFFLFHQNCAIYNLAAKYRQFCLLELHLIQTVLCARITRQQYIFKDQHICGYVIRATESESSSSA